MLRFRDAVVYAIASSALPAFSQELAELAALEFKPSPKALEQKAARRGRLTFEMAAKAPVRRTLQAPDSGDWEALRGRPGATLLGIERETGDLAATAGEWVSLADGRRAWRMAVQAPGATGIRVRFSNFLATSGMVWVYSGANDQVFGPYTGTGIDETGEFWSNTIFDDTAVVEYQPNGAEDTTLEAAGDEPPFTISRISQLAEPERTLAASGPGASGACQLDVNCYNDWNPSGVGQMIFQSNGGSYLCTGSLLNNSNKDFKPYFLTANHCISDAASAQSLEVYWNYQTKSCNGEPLGLASSSRSLGAKYLISKGIGQGDFSLVLLNGLPNLPLTFYGWTSAADALAPGAKTAGIHHPKGDYTKISFGHRVADQTVSVGGEIAPPESYYRVLHNQGRIEPGSSGSALFNEAKLVVGIASHAPGGDACSIDPFVAGYGRFSAVAEAVRPYLNPWSAPAPPAPAPITTTVGPALLKFTGKLSGTVVSIDQTSLPVSIKTTSTSVIAFTSSTAATWLKLSAASGSASAAAPGGFTVSAIPASVTKAGTYKGSVVVTAGGSIQLVQVQLDITAAPPVPPRSPTFRIGTVADGAGLFSTITLVNPSQTVMTTEITFTGANNAAVTLPITGGEPASKLTRSIPAGGTVIIETAGTSRTLTLATASLKLTGTATSLKVTIGYAYKPKN